MTKCGVCVCVCVSECVRVRVSVSNSSGSNDKNNKGNPIKQKETRLIRTLLLNKVARNGIYMISMVARSLYDVSQKSWWGEGQRLELCITFPLYRININGKVAGH